MRLKDGFQGQKAIIVPRKILTDYCEVNDIIRNIYVTDIGYYPKAKYHYRQRPAGADQYILIYCVDGKGQADIDGTMYPIEAGDFFMVPQNVAHTYFANEDHPWTIYWIHFKGKLAKAYLEQLEKKANGYKSFVQFSKKVIDIFKEIYNQLERGYGLENLLHAHTCLSYFFTSIIYNEHHDPGQNLQKKDLIDNAIDYLQENICETLTLEEIASEVNLSASHFSYLFKKKTGFSPIEYFNQLKVQKACQYLLFTDLRVREISLELGITDPHYFTRMFTKVMGISPNHYRDKKIH